MMRLVGRLLRPLAVAAMALIALLRLARVPLALPVTRYVVDGPSMQPAYRPGERLLVNRLAYIRRAPAPGDVVVLRDPERPARYLLKRIGAARADSAGAPRYDVLGDNAADSRDSRHFGPVPRRAIIGKAWLKY